MPSEPANDRDRQLAEAVLQRGWLTPEQLAECQASLDHLRQASIDLDLERLLVVRGLISPAQLAEALRPSTSPGAEDRPPGSLDPLGQTLPPPPPKPPESGPDDFALTNSSLAPLNPAEPAAQASAINLNLVQSAADINTRNVFPDAAPARASASIGSTADPGVRSREFGEIHFVDREQPPGLEAMDSALASAAPGPFPDPAATSPVGVDADRKGATPSRTAAADEPGSFTKKTLRPGMSLGPYKLVRPLGAGAFGWVYLAEADQSILGRRVALKIPKSQRLNREELERYQHEAKLWGALSQNRHPNVLELYDLNRLEGIITFVMEYVDGANLADYAAQAWKQGPFPATEATRVIRGIAEALRVIHSKRVYHGDLKPANVLIRSEDGAVKVTDFSISRSVTARGAVPDHLVAGTPAYMAPEVWEGKSCLQSDIFALGVMFYELVTGARPFQAADSRALREAIQRGEPHEPATALRPDLPFEIERIIRRCLEVSVEDRYASVSELVEDLHAADTSQDLVTRLAECVLRYSSKDDVEFLERDLRNKGYRGDDCRTLVIEYCLDEDPGQILLSCFSKAGLARLAERLGAPVGEDYADREQYAQAILRRLGLAGGTAPRGIHESVVFVTNLRHRLEQARDAADVAGLVTPAAREYEKVLRDLARFYGQFLYGRFYERALVRLARKRLAERNRDLARVTLGELISVHTVLNEHLAGDSAEAQHFFKVFRRRHAVPPGHLAGSRITALRNTFMHWNETLAQASLAKVRDAARDLLNDIVEFLQVMERDGIYPRLVMVESFVTDHYGRKYIFCRNDQGQVEKVFTQVAVDPCRHYFFYPTTNPMRIYPILVPTS